MPVGDQKTSREDLLPLGRGKHQEQQKGEGCENQTLPLGISR